jgi:hypothetical protein
MVSLGLRFSPSFGSRVRNHLIDPGPRFGMLANVSSVVPRRSPIVFSPANFAAFRIRVGKRTISTAVSSGRSGPRSNISQPHLALTFSPDSTGRLVARWRNCSRVQLIAASDFIAASPAAGIKALGDLFSASLKCLRLTKALPTASNVPLDNGTMSRVQQEVVGLVALACALEDSAGDKGPGCGRFSREMAANFL